MASPLLKPYSVQGDAKAPRKVRAPLPDLVQKTLKSSVWDGAYFSLMVGLGESYFAAYALALGLSELATGQLAVVPVAIGAILQFFGPKGVSWLKSRRRWVVFCAMLQTCALICISLLGLMPNLPKAAIFVFTTIYWSAGMSAGPAWNAWISKVIPKDHRLRFFSLRNRVIQLFTLIGLMGGGVVLYHAKTSVYYLPIFSGMIGLAAFCRVMSMYYLARQSDQVELNTDKAPSLAARFAVLKSKKAMTFLCFLFLMSFAVHWSAPYFTPYMLKQLKLDYLNYMFLVSIAFLSRVISYPILERLAEAKGVSILLVIGCIGVMPSPSLWVVSDHFVYLVLLQAYSGICWGAYELGTALLIFERHPSDELPNVYTAVNFLNALGMILGSSIAALFFSSHTPTASDYHTVFLSSSTARMIPVLLLPLIYRKVKSG